VRSQERSLPTLKFYYVNVQVDSMGAQLRDLAIQGDAKANGVNVIASAVTGAGVCANYAEKAIVMIRSMQFLQCQDSLIKAGKPLRPLIVVDKTKASDGYYDATFVVSRRASGNPLTEKKRWRLLLTEPSSASGYVAPLHFLWERGVIAAPTPAAAEEHFVKVERVRTHDEVRRRVGVDTLAVGATHGLLSSEEEKDLVRILKYYSLPQDILAVSADIATDGDMVAPVESWLLNSEPLLVHLRDYPTFIVDTRRWQASRDSVALWALDQMRRASAAESTVSTLMRQGARLWYKSALVCWLLAAWLAVMVTRSTTHADVYAFVATLMCLAGVGVLFMIGHPWVIGVTLAYVCAAVALVGLVMRELLLKQRHMSEDGKRRTFAGDAVLALGGSAVLLVLQNLLQFEKFDWGVLARSQPSDSFWQFFSRSVIVVFTTSVLIGASMQKLIGMLRPAKPSPEK